MTSNPIAPPRNQLLQGDCIEQLGSFEPGTLDLVFADPPYNIGYSYDQYQDTLDEQEYIDWTRQWITACADALAPHGSLYVLIGDEFAADARIILRDLQRQGKLLFRNWIVWHYTFGQRCKVKFNRSHAHLFYCVGSAAMRAVSQGRVRRKKSESDDQFAARRAALEGDRGGAARFVPRSDLVKNPPFVWNREAVAVPSARLTTYADKRADPKGKIPDDTWLLKHFPAMKDWHLRPQEATAEDEQYFNAESDTWYQSRLCGTFKERQDWHPCQLPEALLERIIRLSSNPGDLVFDPFSGSATTLAVAKRLGRDYLGCEVSEQYAQKGRQRLNKVTPQTAEAAEMAENQA